MKEELYEEDLLYNIKNLFMGLRSGRVAHSWRFTVRLPPSEALKAIICAIAYFMLT